MRQKSTAAKTVKQSGGSQTDTKLYLVTKWPSDRPFFNPLWHLNAQNSGTEEFSFVCWWTSQPSAWEPHPRSFSKTHILWFLQSNFRRLGVKSPEGMWGASETSSFNMTYLKKRFPWLNIVFVSTRRSRAVKNWNEVVGDLSAQSLVPTHGLWTSCYCQHMNSEMGELVNTHLMEPPVWLFSNRSCYSDLSGVRLARLEGHQLWVFWLFAVRVFAVAVMMEHERGHLGDGGGGVRRGAHGAVFASPLTPLRFVLYPLSLQSWLDL